MKIILIKLVRNSNRWGTAPFTNKFQSCLLFPNFEVWSIFETFVNCRCTQTFFVFSHKGWTEILPVRALFSTPICYDKESFHVWRIILVFLSHFLTSIHHSKTAFDFIIVFFCLWWNSLKFLHFLLCPFEMEKLAHNNHFQCLHIEYLTSCCTKYRYIWFCKLFVHKWKKEEEKVSILWN